MCILSEGPVKYKQHIFCEQGSVKNWAKTFQGPFLKSGFTSLSTFTVALRSQCSSSNCSEAQSLYFNPISKTLLPVLDRKETRGHKLLKWPLNNRNSYRLCLWESQIRFSTVYIIYIGAPELRSQVLVDCHGLDYRCEKPSHVPFWFTHDGQSREEKSWLSMLQHIALLLTRSNQIIMKVFTTSPQL